MKYRLLIAAVLLAAGASVAQEAVEPAAPAEGTATEKDKAAEAEKDAAVLEMLAAAAEEADKDEEQRQAEIAAERKKAVGEEHAKLVTVKGRTFHKVVINGVDDLGIRIRHEAGTARVSFDEVDPELQERFGYDPSLASEQARKEAAAAAAFARAAVANLRAAQASDKPGSTPNRPAPGPSGPSAGPQDDPDKDPRIVALEGKIAIIERGLVKLQDSAANYQERAAELDRKAVRGSISEDGTDIRRTQRVDPSKTRAADRWRKKATEEFEKIDEARKLIIKYRNEIRAIERSTK